MIFFISSKNSPTIKCEHVVSLFHSPNLGRLNRGLLDRGVADLSIEGSMLFLTDRQRVQRGRSATLKYSLKSYNMLLFTVLIVSSMGQRFD